MDQKYIWICKETDLNNPKQFQVIYKLVIGDSNKFWSQYKTWNYKHIEIVEKIDINYGPWNIEDCEINKQLKNRIKTKQKIFCKHLWIFPWNVDLKEIIETLLEVFKQKNDEFEKYIKELIGHGMLI